MEAGGREGMHALGRSKAMQNWNAKTYEALVEQELTTSHQDDHVNMTSTSIFYDFEAEEEGKNAVRHTNYTIAKKSYFETFMIIVKPKYSLSILELFGLLDI